MIHPTALIDPKAQLGAHVEVGAYSIIGPEVALGDHCRVLSHCVLEGRVIAGDHNFFGTGCVIGSPPQDFAFDPASPSSVRIGSHNTFREYVTIHRGTKPGSETVVGNHCYLMANSHLGHNVCLGSRVVMANAALLGGYAEVADGAVLGGGALVHQFTKIGRLAMLRGGGRVSKDVPPFCFADDKNILCGINSLGLRRAGISPPVRLEIRSAYHLIFLSGLNISQALEKASQQVWGSEAREFFEFIKSSKRGVCRAASRRQDEDFVEG